MKFLFIVQGEGRGHMTQAISLREILTKNGHEVVGVMVGISKRRELPDFFTRNIQSEIYRFNSPNFLPSKKKTTRIWSTIAYNFMIAGRYISSISLIKKLIKELEADVVINFYELMGGLTYALFTPKVPCVCIAHQYLFLHPEYVLPEAHKAELYLMKFFTKVTSARASLILALSTQRMDDVPGQKLVIVPPLLRKDVYEIPVQKGNYIHGYMLNDTYADEIIRFQQDHPDIYIDFFWDRREVPDKLEINDHLTFHRLNDHLFLEYMAGCEAYATTAGFESVCEAMYMGKPVLMVPTHIEQECNAFEAANTGAGIVADEFNLQKLIDFLPHYKENPEFKTWAEEAETRIIKALADLEEKGKK
ncbi:glycosyltransferase [Bacteroidales bacterium OttesenSCG-928-A17]|nr:glycosyltransferase [Bacteroidales bacterium OttesenSCG-928-A17]